MSGRHPTRYAPDARTLLCLVQAIPGLCLRQISRSIWPTLTWAEALTTEMEIAGEITTPARWLADRLAELVAAGHLRHAPRRRQEADPLASLCYQPSTLARVARVGHA